MSKPYEEYVNKSLSKMMFSAPAYKDEQGKIRIGETYWTTISQEDLQTLLTDAWMDGLKYSLVMIESEKQKRDAKEA